MLRSLLILTLAVISTIHSQDSPAGYLVETIKLPANAIMGIGGMAFDDRDVLYVSTREGEVWWYSDGYWIKFAEGLHEPLGLYIEKETRTVYVLQRPELTRIRDINGDGLADVFETVNADWGLTDNYHEYAFGLARDSKGNFYGSLNTTLSLPAWNGGEDKWDVGRVHGSAMGRATQYRGWVFQVDPSRNFTPWASGMRSPCGIGINRHDELFYTDNQGDWVATSTLHHVEKGKFYGHPSSLMDHPEYSNKNLNEISIEQYDAMRTKPIVYFPHGELANSPGEPVFDYSDGKFGPFSGQMFVGDQTQSNVVRVVLEKVGGAYQGVAFNFVRGLECGVIRSEFDSEGGLWLGQTARGWGSVGDEEYGIRRITWDQKTTPTEIHTISLTKSGFRLDFTNQMDLESLAALSNYTVRSWTYHYHPKYGSPKVDFRIEIASVKVINATTIELTVPLDTNRVYHIECEAVSDAGDRLTNPIGYYTLNRLR